MGGRRSKQDIINTVGTMGLKGIETSWNNSTAKVHEGTDEVLEGTAQEYESTAGANLSTAEIKVPLLFVKVPLVLSDILERTACFIRYRARFGFIEEVITKTIDYHLFDIVVEFHRCVSYHILKYSFAGYDFKDNLFVLKWCDEDLSKSSKGV
ncbi:hypothetical protein Tco_0132263 [Tanacetum coccineum]